MIGNFEKPKVAKVEKAPKRSIESKKKTQDTLAAKKLLQKNIDEAFKKKERRVRKTIDNPTDEEDVSMREDTPYEEYHSEEPVDLDNITLEHIVGNKELLPDPENEEERKLLERFGTTDPKIIDKLLQTDEYTEVIDQEDPSIIPTELFSPETSEELRASHLATEDTPSSKKGYFKRYDKTADNQSNLSKLRARFFEWLSRKNYNVSQEPSGQSASYRKKGEWFEKFLSEKKNEKDPQKINDFVEKQHALALEPDDFEDIAHDYQENLRKERRIVNPEDIAA